MARIKQKIKEGHTKEITEPSKDESPRTAQVIDLADLLKQSLGKPGGRKAASRDDEGEAKRKPALKVVPRTAAKKSAASSAKPAARRKRA